MRTISLPFIGLMIVVATAVLITSVTISNRGILKLFGANAYSDSTGTVEINEIDWQLIGRNESKNFTIYLKITGSQNATLTLTTDNYIPESCEEHLNLTWNYTDTILQPNVLTPITFTLTMLDTADGFLNFTFDTTIIAEEHVP